MLENDKPLKPDTGAGPSAPDTRVVMIYATFPDFATALAVGRDMVEQGIAGCVNIVPGMTSVYVWKGETETSDEAVMIAKLAAAGAERAVAYIRSHHPYETPAVLVLPIEGGNADYLSWLCAGTHA